MKVSLLSNVCFLPVSGLAGLPGFPGRPGLPGEIVGSEVRGPSGDPGLPGPDGQYGEYISSNHTNVFLLLHFPDVILYLSYFFHFRFPRSSRTSRPTWSRHISRRQR